MSPVSRRTLQRPGDPNVGRKGALRILEGGIDRRERFECHAVGVHVPYEGIVQKPTDAGHEREVDRHRDLSVQRRVAALDQVAVQQ